MKNSVVNGCGLLLLVCIVFAFTYVASVTSPKVYKVDLPNNSGAATLTIKAEHMFLAESSYSVVIRRGDGSVIREEPHPQWGGQPGMVMTWYPSNTHNGPFMRFEHLNEGAHVDEFIDLKNGSSYGNIRESSKQTLDGNRAFLLIKEAATANVGVSLGWVDNKFRYHKQKPSALERDQLFDIR